MKKRYNQYVEIETFEFLKKEAAKFTKNSVALLIAKMIEFARKNWKEFTRTLNP